MIRRLLLACLCIPMLATGLPEPAAADNAGCPSRSAPPLNGGVYELSQPAHLQWVKDANVSSTNAQWAYDYRLTADIDMTGCEWTSTIGGATNFTGDFDGDGHAITGLEVTKSAQYVGLFGSIAGSDITDLSLRDFTISAVGQRDVGTLAGSANDSRIDNVAVVATSSSYRVVGHTYVGGLVGSMALGTVIHNSVSTADVVAQDTAFGFAGGLVGYVAGPGEVVNSAAGGDVEGGSPGTGGLIGYNFMGLVQGSSATGQVVGDANVGGLVGYNNSGTLEECFARGDVTGASDVGGLVGFNDNGGTVSKCSATGQVTGTTDETGGLVGSNTSNGVIEYSFASGVVTGVLNVGGLVGFSTATIRDSYATGDVSGNDAVGGLAGSVNTGSSTSRAYSTGSATGSVRVAGLIGQVWNGTVTSNYWNTETSGQSGTLSGATGLTSIEMRTSTSFAGWDFTTIWGYDCATTIVFPMLRITNPAFTGLSCPTITSISPSSGSAAGGTEVTVTGTGFLAPLSVTVGGSAATNVAIASETSVTLTTPAGSPGARDLTITSATQPVTSAGAFTYTAVPDPPAPNPPTPSPSSSPTASPAVPESSPTAAPEADEGLTGASTSQPLGTVGASLGGQPISAVIAPAPRGQGVRLQIGPLALSLRSLTPRGGRVPLNPDGALVLARSGSLPVAGSGVAPGSQVTLALYSTPISLGSTLADADGHFAMDVSIPAWVPKGPHTLQISGMTDGQEPFVASIGVEVTSPVAAMGANPLVRVTPRTAVSGSGVAVTVTGVQSLCAVRITVPGRSLVVTASRDGVARAILQLPRTSRKQVTVKASVRGPSCDAVTASVPLAVTRR